MQRCVAMNRLAPLLLLLAATGHAASEVRPAGRTTVVSLLGDELLAVPDAHRADAEILFPVAASRRATLTVTARCAGRCGKRPRMLSVRVLGEGGTETEIARLQPPAAGGKATLDVTRHAALFAGHRTLRVLVDSLRAQERSGWRVDASLVLEAAPAPKKPVARPRLAAR